MEGVTRSSKIYFLVFDFDAASPESVPAVRIARLKIVVATVRAVEKLAMITPLYPGGVGQLWS
jgi:hypothetical protein